jgi:hypothetical protein
LTWTYDNTSITTDLAKVRLRAGLTNTDDQILTDEEINYQLSLTSDLDQAAAACLRLAIASYKVTRATDRNGTGFSATRSQRFQHMKDLLEVLEAQGATSISVTVDFGSKSAKAALESDSDFVPAAFHRDLHDTDTSNDSESDD